MTQASPHKTHVDVSSERDMVLTRHFDAPRDLVWAAWTDPAHLAAWWGPHGMENTVDQDLRPGGHQNITMRDGDGNAYPITSVVREIVPGERLVTAMGTDEMSDGWQQEFSAKAGGATDGPPRILMTVTFEDAEDGGTVLTVRQTFDSADFRDANMEMGAETGWGESFDKLDSLLSKTVTRSH